MATAAPVLRIRWLGRVAYDDALALQRRLHAHSSDDHLLLLEHPHVVTLGRRGSREHVLADVEALGGTVEMADRGGEVTYHGPGQLVGYPILTVPGRRGGGMADTAAYVSGVEQVLIDVLAEMGVNAGRLRRHTGVWVDPDGPTPRKIAAIGVRLSRARSMHGFALNVDPDLSWFARIVPCGITSLGVTSLTAEGVNASMRDVVDLLARRAAEQWAPHGRVDRADVSYRTAQGGEPLNALAVGGNEADGEAADGEGHRVIAHMEEGSGNGADGGAADREGNAVAITAPPADAPVPWGARKPEWMRVPLRTGADFRKVRSTVRDLGLVTVCEEAGCPNISECWNDGTATFMILGQRCTRACSFCLVDTQRPGPVDESEPGRVAEAAARMGLEHVVVTMVARDDLSDGGAAAMARTVITLRQRLPTARVETLISDLGGDPEALQKVFDVKPDVLNHNIETVARLQRSVRPSAGYARSLSVLARAKTAGLTTKSSIIAGLGETHDEIVQTLADLHAVGTDIVTIGQYLRPSQHHAAVARWWPPEMFERWKQIGESLGIAHVEASPLTRSSYHARQSAEACEDAEIDGSAEVRAASVSSVAVSV